MNDLIEISKEMKDWADIPESGLTEVQKRLVRAWADVIVTQQSKEREIPRDKIARLLADNRGGHKGFPPAEWDYDLADAIIDLLNKDANKGE